jgi:hypothetical protein
VGLYAGEVEGFYLVLGGNQSDSVNFTLIDKARCTSMRWPKDIPIVGRPFIIPEESVREFQRSVNEA